MSVLGGELCAMKITEITHALVLGLPGMIVISFSETIREEGNQDLERENNGYGVEVFAL